MVRYWLRSKEPRLAAKSASINGFGAFATGVVTLLVIQAKFTSGRVDGRDRDPRADRASSSSSTATTGSSTAGCSSGTAAVKAAPEPTNNVVALRRRASTRRRGWRPGTRTRSRVRATTPSGSRTAARSPTRADAGGSSRAAGTRIEPLEGVGHTEDAVLDYVWSLPRGESNFLTVVVPEAFEKPSLLTAVLRRHTTFSLKLRLLSEPGIVIANVPVVDGNGAEPIPKRAVARVLVSEVHASSLRAVNYARTLKLADTKAVFFAFDGEEAARVEQEWHREAIGLPLEIRRGPVPRPRRPAARLPPRADGRPGHGRLGRHARARLQRRPQAAAQPAGALHQAAAALRAPRLPVQRPLPPAMRILVGFDGSDASKRALVHAAELVGRGGNLDVINVIGSQPVSARVGSLVDGERQRQRKVLHEAQCPARGVGRAHDPAQGDRRPDERDPRRRRGERGRRDRRRPREAGCGA